MKIYTHIKIDMASGEVLEEKSFDYPDDRLVLRCNGGGGGGDTNIESPEPTPEERELTRLSIESARRQREITEALEPIFLEQAGLRRVETPIVGESERADLVNRSLAIDKEIQRLSTPPGPEADYGEKLRWVIDHGESQIAALRNEKENIERRLGATRFNYEEIPYEELSPEAQRASDIQRLQEERQLAALRGELEVDPALEARLKRERSALELGLRRGGGLSSTAGIQALGRFGEEAGLLRSASQRGELTSGEAALLQRTGLTSSLRSKALSGVGTGYLPLAQITGGTAANLGGIRASLFGTEAQLAARAREAQAQETAALYGAIGSIAGTGTSYLLTR